MSEAPLPAAQDDPDALESFVDKWRARWPEWSVAEVFVPPRHRIIALAWASLQQEFTDAAWGGSDARPGEAKLAWWQEELQGWALGRRRHPLGITLQRQRAPWSALSSALPSLRLSRERPIDAVAAFSDLLPLAIAVAEVEQVLFAAAPADPGTARLVCATWLQARLAREGSAAVPLSTLARVGDDAAEASWRDDLLQEWPDMGRATRPRRLWAAIARSRLARGDASRPLGPMRALWTAWRAARG